jgi:ATP-binding protein involved in chromosome partitioning
MSFTEQQIKAALSAAVDPNTGKDFVAGKALKNVRIDGSDVSFDIELGYPAKTQIDAIRKQVIAAVRTLPGIGNVSANVFSKIVAHSVQLGVKLMPGVKNIIADARQGAHGGDHLLADGVDLRLGRIAEFDVEGNVAAIDPDVLEGLAGNEILARIGIDRSRQRGLDLLFSKTHENSGLR